MPTYDFRCENQECQEVIEVFFHDRNNVPEDLGCPECGAPAVRLLNNPPFKFASRHPVRVMPGGARGMD